MKTTLNILAIYLLLLSGLPLRAGGSTSAKNPPPADEGKKGVKKEPPPPLQTRDVLLKLSREVIDPLKKKVDEWGTLGFAPLMLAPPEYTGLSPDGKTQGTQTPFALQEKSLAPNEQNPFSMDALYAAQNMTNGQIRTSQRTQTHTALSAEMDTSEIAKAVVEGKLKLLNASQTKVLQGAAAQQTLTQTQLATAQQNLPQAQANATAADAQAAAATAAYNQARTTALAALQATVGLQGQALADAKEQQAQADLAAAKAKADLTQATSQQSDAQAALTAAQGAVTAAQGAVANAQKTALALPADPSLPGNTAGGSAAPVDNPLKNLNFTDMRTLSKTDNLSKDTSGMNSKLPATAVKADSDAGSFPPLMRINAAASVLTVKKILSFLGDPSSAVNFDGKRLLFAVSSLSVNPGWRTREGFKAVITGDIEIDYEDAHGETIREMLNSPDYPPGLRALIAKRYPGHVTAAQREFFRRYDDLPHDRQPKLADFTAYLKTEEETTHALKEQIVVTAVSPMVDAQNLDLSSSVARQEELALMLSASLAQAGSAGAANFFTSWAKMRRKDVNTLNSVASANSFSNGDRFGFEVGTRLRGLDEEDANGRKPAQILDRQTIPVLFILGVTDAVARPVIVAGKKGFSIQQPKLVFGYTTRWARQEHSFWSFLKTERRSKDSQGEILSNALLRDEARRELEHSVPDVKSAAGRQLAEVLNVMISEYGSLVKNLYGADYDQSLPARWLLNNLGASPHTDADLHDPLVEVERSALRFEPESLKFDKLGQTATLVIRGKGLGQLDGTGIVATGGGVVRDSTEKIIQTPDALFLKMRAVSASADPVSFKIPYKEAGGVTGLASRKVLKTMPLACEVKITEVPEIADWTPPANLVVAGDFSEGAWRQNQVQVILRGTHLEQLAGAKSTAVRGVGVSVAGAGPAGVKVRESGPGAAVVEFPLAAAAGEGEIILQFEVGDATVFSKPLPFQFKNAAAPAISAWDPGEKERLVQAPVANNQRTAKLQLRLRGQALQRLGAPEVRAAFACKTDVVVKDAEPNVMLLEIAFSEVLAQVNGGAVYLAFPDKQQPAAPPTLSDTLTVQFLPKN